MSTNTEQQMLTRRHAPEIACCGKHQYDTRSEAIEVCDRRRRSKRRTKWHPYRCGYCNGWHIGSKGIKRPGPLPILHRGPR